jgi:hypothetical protein
MTAAKDEVPADQIATPAVIALEGSAIPQLREKRIEVDRATDRSVARQNDRPLEKETVPRREENRIGNAFHGQPDLARDHGIAFDAFILGVPDGQVARHIVAAGRVAAWF